MQQSNADCSPILVLLAAYAPPTSFADQFSMLFEIVQNSALSIQPLQVHSWVCLPMKTLAGAKLIMLLRGIEKQTDTALVRADVFFLKLYLLFSHLYSAPKRPSNLCDWIISSFFTAPLFSEPLIWDSFFSLPTMKLLRWTAPFHFRVHWKIFFFSWSNHRLFKLFHLFGKSYGDVDCPNSLFLHWRNFFNIVNRTFMKYIDMHYLWMSEQPSFVMNLYICEWVTTANWDEIKDDGTVLQTYW